MTYPVDAMRLPPRYFWRRFLAYLIDAWLISLILGVPLGIATIVIYGPILPTSGMQQCQQQDASAADNADIALAMKLTAHDRVSILSCPMHDLLHGDRETILVTATDSSAAQSQFPKFGFFTRDAAGLHPANVIARSLIPELIVWILIPLAFALLSANGRRTLGKKAVGLIVKRVDDHFPPFGQALGRECLKLLPATALNAVIVVVMIKAEDFPFGLFRSFLAGDYQPLITILEWGLALEMLLLIWWLGPFIVWRGQTWHDRLAGTKVVLK